MYNVKRGARLMNGRLWRGIINEYLHFRENVDCLNSSFVSRENTIWNSALMFPSNSGRFCLNCYWWGWRSMHMVLTILEFRVQTVEILFFGDLSSIVKNKESEYEKRMVFTTFYCCWWHYLFSLFWLSIWRDFFKCVAFKMNYDMMAR